MPASPQSDQPHFARRFVHRAGHNIAAAQANFIRKSEHHSIQELCDQVLRIVDELFHAHDLAFSFVQRRIRHHDRTLEPTRLGGQDKEAHYQPQAAGDLCRVPQP